MPGTRPGMTKRGGARLGMGSHDPRSSVMAGLVPAIHVFLAGVTAKQGVDARHKGRA